MLDTPTYVSDTGSHIARVCGGKWMVQKAKHRKRSECWKLAYADDDAPGTTLFNGVVSFTAGLGNF